MFYVGEARTRLESHRLTHLQTKLASGGYLIVYGPSPADQSPARTRLPVKVSETTFSGTESGSSGSTPGA